LFRSGPAGGRGAEPSDGEVQERAPLLCLDDQRGVGVGLDAPQAKLDVAGALRCQGRRGSFQRQVPVALDADGKWQDLTDDLEGCQAFEVMAGTGRPGSERFGLMHAIAMNAYNPTLGIFNFLNRRRGIRTTHAYYSRR